MAIVTSKQGCLTYDAPKVRVIKIAMADVIRTSPENGGEDNSDWWEGVARSNVGEYL